MVETKRGSPAMKPKCAAQSLDLGFGLGFRVTWRFMGSYKWAKESPNLGDQYSYPTYTLLITTHEPPSRVYGGPFHWGPWCLGISEA